MKLQLFHSLAAVALLAGCMQTPPNQGAAVDNDQNVLTGGPITGTTLKDLPQPVRDTLKRRAPHEEIADIDRAQAGAAEIEDIAKSSGPGPTVYEVRFTNPELFPTLYVSPDGSVLTSNLAVAVGATEDTINAATGGVSSGLKVSDLPPTVV